MSLGRSGTPRRHRGASSWNEGVGTGISSHRPAPDSCPSALSTLLAEPVAAMRTSEDRPLAAAVFSFRDGASSAAGQQSGPPIAPRQAERSRPAHLESYG